MDTGEEPVYIPCTAREMREFLAKVSGLDETACRNTVAAMTLRNIRFNKEVKEDRS
jgi:hypothetical protein